MIIIKPHLIFYLVLITLLTGCVVPPGSIEELTERQNSLESRLAANSSEITDIQRKVEIQEARIRSLEKNYSDIYMKMDDLRKKQSVKSAKQKSADDLYNSADKSYKKGEYTNAILTYQILIDTYPNDKRVADAYLKQGLSLVKIGRKNGAKFFFKTLIERFPGSREAEIAKQELKKINSS
ncbi:MAG: tetratricopeptide repeat protein [Deltaproteobacteria bacterium]